MPMTGPFSPIESSDAAANVTNKAEKDNSETPPERHSSEPNLAGDDEVKDAV